jgi:hypothetical protein
VAGNHLKNRRSVNDRSSPAESHLASPWNRPHRQVGHASEQGMTTSLPSLFVPSESDNEVDNTDADLPPEHVWAYPCKLPSYPDYSKSWLLRSNFLLYLQKQDVHKATAITPIAHRTIEKEWRYTTDPHLPR